MRTWINLIEGREPFTDNMIPACTAAQVGFHFEEGGCWGMALALHDAFTKLGLHPELVVTPNQGHALVRLGSELFDHSGETFTKLPLKVVSIEGLFQEAEAAGVPEDEVLADKELATEIIENAATGDWPVEETVNEGSLDRKPAYPTLLAIMNMHLVENAMPRQNFLVQVRGIERRLNTYLIKLMAFEADEGMRNHWKREVYTFCRDITGVKFKSPKGARPVRASEYFEQLFEAFFGEPSEVQNVGHICTYIQEDYPDLRRNDLTDQQVWEKLKAWHTAASQSMCKPPFDRALIEKL
jgi:hypothetical protein